MRENIRYFVWLFLLFLNNAISYAQLNTYSFREVEQLQKVVPKPVIVFLYTDWCKYCQTMKNTTFKDEQIIQTLNESFYFIIFNAEQREDVLFLGSTFKYKPTGFKIGVHELAAQLGTVNGKVSYPTLSILNPDFEIIFQHNQFLSAKDLSRILNATLLVD